MKRIVLVMLSLLCLASAQAVSNKMETKGGPPIVGIVLPEKATPAEKRAASELQHYLAIMTGDTLPVTTESERKRLAGRVISVGKTEAARRSLPASGWAEETVLIDTRSWDNVVITGGSDTAVLFATYRFLHDLGCRWLKPGEDGEYVPKVTRLKLTSNRLIASPDFRVRGWLAWTQYCLMDKGNKNPIGTWATPAETDLKDWGVRNGLNSITVTLYENLGIDLGQGYTQRMGHTLWQLIPSGSYDPAATAKLFAEHPEYYPLVNGVRVAKYTDGRPVQACLSNPEVVKLVAQKVSDFLPGWQRFQVGHNDEPTYWCECPNCLALDGPDSKWVKNDLYDAYPDRSRAGPGPMSARHVHFINEVAKIVGRQFPDVYVSFYAYGSTTSPPRGQDWKLEKNVMVEYANADISVHHRIFDPSCKANSTFAKWLKGWTSTGQPVVIYDYEPYPGRWTHMDAPVFWYTGLADYVRSAKRLGVYGWAGENTQMWAGSALWFYLKANLLWDTKSDVNKLIADFCDHYYGSAGPTMKKYYRLLDSATQYPSHVGVSRGLKDIKPEMLKQANQLLEEATARASDERSASHIMEARTALLSLRCTLLQEARQTDPKAFEEYRQLVSQLEHLLLTSNTPIPISPGLYQELISAYEPPFEAMGGRVVSEFPIEWKFRTDPKDEGEKLGWPAAIGNEAEWRPIKTNDSWTNQSYPGGYHGIAWYVTSFDAPETINGRLWLLFGAIDGDAWFWINGKPAGKTVAVPDIAWDKPFALDITNAVTRGEKNWLVVKVRKDTYAAGIWKPVKLMESPKSP